MEEDKTGYLEIFKYGHRLENFAVKSSRFRKKRGKILHFK